MTPGHDATKLQSGVEGMPCGAHGAVSGRRPNPSGRVGVLLTTAQTILGGSIGGSAVESCRERSSTAPHA